MHHGTHEPSAAGFSYIIADDHLSVMIAVSKKKLAELQGVAASRFTATNPAISPNR